MAAPLPVSVVIPAYNRASMVGRAVRSALAQDPPPAEVLVVDDASSDATAAAARDAGATVVVHEVNGGEGAARNTGLRAAAHEWVALLDSDDEWLPGHLQRVWDARGSHVLVADAALSEQPRRLYGWPGRRPHVLRSPRQLAFPENVVQPSCALVRADVLLAAGGFPEDRRYMVDLLAWLRLLEHGTGLVLPAVGVRYVLHDEQISARRSDMRNAHRALMGELSGRPWHSPALDPWVASTAAWDEDRGRAVREALRSPRRLEGLVRTLVWRRRIAWAGRRLD